jgi:hypothetical protein
MRERNAFLFGGLDDWIRQSCKALKYSNAKLVEECIDGQVKLEDLQETEAEWLGETDEFFGTWLLVHNVWRAAPRREYYVESTLG